MSKENSDSVGSSHSLPSWAPVLSSLRNHVWLASPAYCSGETSVCGGFVHILGILWSPGCLKKSGYVSF